MVFYSPPATILIQSARLTNETATNVRNDQEFSVRNAPAEQNAINTK